MAYPLRLLEPGETILWHRRPHWKAALPAAVVFVVVTAAAGMAGGLIEKHLGGGPDDGAVGVAVLYALLGALWAGLVWWRCAVPWWRWRSTHFVVTDRRVLVRRGVLSRATAELDRDAIGDVRMVRSVTDRFVGAGTLVLRSAAADPVVLGGAPGAKGLQRLIRDAA